jgi:pimeloyl-ACP methyl ester carboxylesterase
VRIAFTDLGGAGGEPLLLIMGLAVSRFWWPPGLVDELVRRGFHVAAYDRRDAGQSTRFPDTGAASPVAAVLRSRSPACTAEDMTDDAVAVLDALGWDSAHLFGHSMGGQLAQRTLSQLRVPALVLHGAQDPLLRPAAARRTAAAIRGARLVILPGVGHYLPAAVYPQIADEVRALGCSAGSRSL